jgi:hypothetical protein
MNRLTLLSNTFRFLPAGNSIKRYLYMGIDIEKIFQENCNQETLKAKLLLYFKDAEMALANKDSKLAIKESELAIKDSQLANKDSQVDDLRNQLESKNTIFKIVNTQLHFELQDLNLRRLMEEIESDWKLLYREKGSRRDGWIYILKDDRMWNYFQKYGFIEKDHVVTMAVDLYRKFSQGVHEKPTRRFLYIKQTEFLVVELNFIRALADITKINVEFYPKSDTDYTSSAWD